MEAFHKFIVIRMSKQYSDRFCMLIVPLRGTRFNVIVLGCLGRLIGTRATECTTTAYVLICTMASYLGRNNATPRAPNLPISRRPTTTRSAAIEH